jgi:NAD(P)-dependent dehydrogenase (short-subunit alcohol dehydrogenase family)
MADLGWSSTTDDVMATLLGSDRLDGFSVLVTGASTGLGEETCRALMARGAQVFMGVRDLSRGRAAVERITAQVSGGPHPTLIPLDLESLHSVREAASTVAEHSGRLNAVINNAGIMACPQARTVDGFERQMGTNHLGHHLLARLLTPCLVEGAQQRGRPSRVISLSSRGHSFGDVDLDDLHYEHSPYEPFDAYGRSKTANALFAVAFDQRHAADGVRAYSVHPGGIHTELGRHMTRDLVASLMANIGGADTVRWKTIPQGAATTLWALLNPDLEARGGAYCEDCSVAVVSDDASTSSGVRPYAVDPDRASALWALSDTVTGVR